MVDKTAVGTVPIGLTGKAEIVKPEQLLFDGELGATIEWTVREGIFDENGKITEHVGPRRSESYVRQFLDNMWMLFNSSSALTGVPSEDTSGNTHQMYSSSYQFNCQATIGVVNTGIVVGTGSTTPTENDYALQTLILHDSSPPTSGRMQYGALTFGAPSTDNVSIAQFTITRNFANSSGASITVNEIGLYVQSYKLNGGPQGVGYFMTIHDVISGGIAVPNGQTLTVNYRPQTQV